MKIGYLVQNLNRKTGGGRFASDIVDGVKKHGHEVVILKEDNDGGEGYPVLGRGLKIFTGAYKSLEYLRGCDVIHAIDGYPYGITAWLANRVIGTKLIISALGTYAVAPLYRWPTSFFLKRAYASADKVVPISRFTQQEILKKINLNNTVVINPGIKLIEKKEKIKADKKFILGVGGIKERKGYHIALSAFALISQKFPDLNYVLVGDEDLAFQTILDPIVEKNNLKARVKFLHQISEDDLQKLYLSAELFILTPINTAEHHFEGYGIVFLEAARAGLPVIGTRGSGVEDAIKKDYNGLLVPQNDPQKTAEAIASILSNDIQRQGMSEASYIWAQENGVDFEVVKLLSLYRN